MEYKAIADLVLNRLKQSQGDGRWDDHLSLNTWEWPQGVAMYAMLKVYEATKDENLLDEIETWYDGHIGRGLPGRNINTTAPMLGLTLLYEARKKEKYLPVISAWAEWVMNGLPRTEEGGFQHITSDCLNEQQLWDDTLFMTVLFLNYMGQQYGRQDWIEESIHQVLMHIKYLYEKKTGLFYHGWTFKENNNFGGIFWCRGNSWFTLGILDYLEMFHNTLNPGVKQIIIDTYKAQVHALKKLQAPSGLWHTVLDDPTSYEEVSGSAAIAAGILKGIRMGILDDACVRTAEKAIRGIMDNVAPDGTVLNVSGGTGMGMNADHYKNILIAPMAYGQSLTILAFAEALRHIQ